MKSKVKILVVDDEAPVALMIVFLLTRMGCEAQSSWNVERALHLAQAEEFDLITLDVDMPRMNGFELFQKIKQIPHAKDTPIVFISGNATIERQQYALELGAADFIEKPFDTASFVPQLLSHIRGKTQPAQNSPSEGVAA